MLISAILLVTIILAIPGLHFLEGWVEAQKRLRIRNFREFRFYVLAGLQGGFTNVRRGWKKCIR